MSTNSERLTPAQAEQKLKSLLAEVNDCLAVHDNIRDADDQYEDPEEWWLRPLKRQLEEALNDLETNR